MRSTTLQDGCKRLISKDGTEEKDLCQNEVLPDHDLILRAPRPSEIKRDRRFWLEKLSSKQ